MFQSRLVGDDDSETRVDDFGLGNGWVLQVALHARYKEVVVFVEFWDSESRPWRRAEFSFRWVVPRNVPCAESIKKEVLRICDGSGYALKMTNPHLFLMNYSLDDPAVISLGDDLCLDEVTSEINPLEVYESMWDLRLVLDA